MKHIFVLLAVVALASAVPIVDQKKNEVAETELAKSDKDLLLQLRSYLAQSQSQSQVNAGHGAQAQHQSQSQINTGHGAQAQQQSQSQGQWHKRSEELN
ncbi:unnamed protein product [Clavelina lepadiformis]|uniref:Secreted protein n=1 Tax=Clavelina lepadiformis TaxID=159417 RepID=A0ABP0GGQ7_CLALP